MRPGDRVGERFELLALSRIGGMGEVWRARDAHDGREVAVKLQRDEGGPMGARFLREARILAALHHPAIVRYVAHGRAPEELVYLAMEWLEGEDLGRRLLRGGLEPSEALALGRRIAGALGTLHVTGVVHRDVKPGNVFLPGGLVAEAKLLDLGIARTAERTGDRTRAGAVIGTIGYMAPEQARGAPEIDARADVFALGCVLYQCLTSRLPYPGGDEITILARILFDDPPRLCDARPDLPGALDALLARMLAKDPAGRPADGRAVERLLEADMALPRGRTGPPDRAPLALTGAEERQLFVVLARAPAATRAPELPGGDETIPLGTPTEVSPPPGAMHADAEALSRLGRRFGAHVETPIDGSVVAAWIGAAPPTDEATRAARLALEIARLLPGHRVALATGRGQVDQRWPVGVAIERALEVWRRASSASAGVWVDEVAATLLAPAFELGGEPGARALLGETLREGARTLLGRRTPMVGRDRELLVLESLWDGVVEDAQARAVLVTAPAGVGKSRLRHELVTRLSQHGPAPMVWMARGDPLGAGSPFGLLARALRAALGVGTGEPPEAQRDRLTAAVAAVLPPSPAVRVRDFLGELVGVPFAGGVQLRAARQDARLLGDQMLRAFLEWTGASLARRPLLCVLEDLHWGDLPTVRFIDAALRAHADRPLMVLALARPEIHDLFPGLWAERGLSEMHLGELPRRAAEKLARTVLGERADAGTVERVVALAAGNAFFLEELLRTVAEGARTLPETVLATLEARLGALAPSARHLLRAASVFGQSFWAGGVRALLCGSDTAADLDGWLEALVGHEIVQRRPESRIQGQPELVFRHALVREAAYGMLTAGDRALGHRLAAGWLEEHGERDPNVLAEHFAIGEVPGRAIELYTRAAEEALSGNDLQGALDRADRALALGATAQERGALRLICAEAHNWRGELVEAERSALEALLSLPPGEARWYSAIAEAAAAAGPLGHIDELRMLCTTLTTGAPLFDGAEVTASARLAEHLVIAGLADLARNLVARTARLDPAWFDANPAARGRLRTAEASLARFEGDAAAALLLTDDAAESFERAGDDRNACRLRGAAGYGRLELGDAEGATRVLSEVIQAAERMGLPHIATRARHNLGLALSRLGRHAEAEAAEIEAIHAFRVAGDRRLLGASHEYLALIRLAAGDVARAEDAARVALEIAAEAPVLPLNQAESLAILARVLLAQDLPARALGLASEGLVMLEQLGGIDDGDALIRLTHAEALEAAGEHAAARAAIAKAVARLEERAGRIADPAWRAGFLEHVPEHARTRALATHLLA